MYFSGSDRAAEATSVAFEALQIGREGRHTRTIVLAAQTCATIAALAGREKRRCVQLFGYVARRWATIGEIGFTEAAAHKRLRGVVSAMVAGSDLADAILEGEVFDDEAAIEAALLCVDSRASAGVATA